MLVDVDGCMPLHLGAALNVDAAISGRVTGDVAQAAAYLALPILVHVSGALD